MVPKVTLGASLFGKEKSKWKSGTPTLASSKILFDQRVLCFTKCLGIADYFSNGQTAMQRGEESAWRGQALLG